MGRKAKKDSIPFNLQQRVIESKRKTKIRGLFSFLTLYLLTFFEKQAFSDISLRRFSVLYELLWIVGWDRLGVLGPRCWCCTCVGRNTLLSRSASFFLSLWCFWAKRKDRMGRQEGSPSNPVMSLLEMSFKRLKLMPGSSENGEI